MDRFGIQLCSITFHVRPQDQTNTNTRLTHSRYNTAVFASLSANKYNYLVISKNSTTQGAIFNSSTHQSDYKFMRTLAMNGTLVEYSALDGVIRYFTTFVSKARHVLLTTDDDDDPKTGSAFSLDTWSASSLAPYAWLCGDGWFSVTCCVSICPSTSCCSG